MKTIETVFEKHWMIKGGDDEGMLFKHSDDVVKYFRDGVGKDYNDASDDFIFDEALTHGWVHEHMVPKSISPMKTIEELDERLSAVYEQLHGIKTDMAKLYEDEMSPDAKVVRLRLVLNDITNIQQTIEDENKEDEMIECYKCGQEQDEHQRFCVQCLTALH